MANATADAGAPAGRTSAATPRDLVTYLAAGTYFGVVLTQSQVISWYRIQEMFRFQAFHMYGIIGSAIAVAALSLAIIRQAGITTIHGDAIVVPPKVMGRGYRYGIGGTLFGIGWALTGACPGPLFALAGNGVSVMVVAIVSALAGTWTYGYLRPRLPH